MVNGNSPRVPMVVVEFDKTIFLQILGEGGIPAWNRYVADLSARNLIPPMWGTGCGDGKPPPLAAMVDLAGIRLRNYRLDGANFAYCWLADADLSSSSLKGVVMGCCPRADLRGARIHGCDFRHVDVSDCRLDGCIGIEEALWDGAVFSPGHAPSGLPPEILSRCEPEADPPPIDRRTPENPAEPTGFSQSPLRCVATIHFVPVE